MKTALKTAAVLLAAAVAFAPTAHADDTDWTGGHPLPPGTQVPFEPGYATEWRSYDVIRFGDPNFGNRNVSGVRVLGAYEGDRILCLMTFKAGMGVCYANGKEATDLGWSRGGKLVTTDPAVSRFASQIRQLASLELQLSSMSGSSLS